jgi:outer membrane autotransporter protein
MRLRPVTAAVAGSLLLTGTQALAANVEFQNFLFAVCTAPGGTLATRCNETTGGTGNVSGDSESSLNPSQALGANLPAVGVAQARSKQARERGEKLRDGESGEGTKVAVGPFSLLLNVTGTWLDRDADPLGLAERGMDGDSVAGEIGLDYRLSDRSVIGAILGVERASYDFDAEAPGVNFVPASSAGRNEADNYYLTLFGSWTLGTSGYVELSGGYERSDGSYRRNSVFQESTRTLPQVNVRAEGDADGTTTWFSVNAGLDIDRGAFSFGPYVGLTRTDVELDGYTESDLNDSGLAMHFSGTERDSLLGHAGVRAGWALSSAAGVVLPQLRVEYQHEFEDDAASATASYVLDPAANRYTMTGASPDRNSVNAGLSLAWVLPNGWMPLLDVSKLFSAGPVDRVRATLGLRKEF